MQLDHERLAQARRVTTVSGQYLAAWNLVVEYMKRNNMTVHLDEYLITFDEDDDFYHVQLTKPYMQPILGGGSAEARVRKCDMYVEDFRFGK